MQPNSSYFTFKKCLLGLVLLTYLVGTFRDGVFEIAHAFSHQFEGGHSYHAHHGEQDEFDHEHTSLDFSKTAFEEHNDTSSSQNKTQKFSFDKIPQICSLNAFQTTVVDLKNRKIPIFNLQLPPTPYLQIIAPPPDFTM